VTVVDGTFNTVMLGPGAFVDPTLPMGYAPFGIQTIGDKIYVAYALRDDTGTEVHGPGLGYVSAFDTMGTFLSVWLRAATSTRRGGWWLRPTSSGRGNCSSETSATVDQRLRARPLTRPRAR
jgi:hypothetical protein